MSPLREKMKEEINHLLGNLSLVDVLALIKQLLCARLFGHQRSQEQCITDAVFQKTSSWWESNIRPEVLFSLLSRGYAGGKGGHFPGKGSGQF